MSNNQVPPVRNPSPPRPRPPNDYEMQLRDEFAKIAFSAIMTESAKGILRVFGDGKDLDIEEDRVFAFAYRAADELMKVRAQ